MEQAPPFTLLDTDRETRAFPGGSGRPTVICFVRSDCPTCVLTLSLVDALHGALAGAADVLLVAQDADGGATLRKDHGISPPVLDDSELRVSYAYDVEVVPTLISVDAEGRVETRFVGFARADWQELVAELATATGREPPAIDWSGYPELRPGRGSRSVEPGIAEQLAAEAEGSPMRARRIALDESDDPVEFLFEQGVTDGLPVAPPTPDRVLRMLEGTIRDPQELVATVPPNLAPATVEKVAINAVMAGCRPEYLPVVIAAVEAVCTEEFNLHGVLATTFFATPVVIVNGPIRDRIGVNYGANCLGQGSRANASIGRALQLLVRNVGGGRPGEIDRATFGQPGKYSFCFAENEERSDWEPLHVERGCAPGESAVTVFAGTGPTGFVDQLSRHASSLATSYGLALAAAGHPKAHFYGEVVVLVPPEHVDTFRREGWTKAQVREQIQRTTERPLRELRRDEACAEGVPADVVERLGPDTRVPKFRSTSDIWLVVCGGEAGKFGAYLQGWASGPGGSVLTTRVIGA